MFIISSTYLKYKEIIYNYLYIYVIPENLFMYHTMFSMVKFAIFYQFFNLIPMNQNELDLISFG